MFAKHLPPSVGRPRVWALDEAAAAELPAEIEVGRPGEAEAGEWDAIVGYAPPTPRDLARWFKHLRPGGRLILADRAEPEALLSALTSAGYIHCLVEPRDDAPSLYRGERPPFGSSVERVQSISNLQSPTPTSFVFLLIHQTPNKPAWTQAPDEKIEWQAATVRDPANGQPTLLAFSSLVKAVAFMQTAVREQWLTGVSKIGKFRAEAAQAWSLPYTLNPKFEAVRKLPLGLRFDVDPQTALTGEA